jgi:hypothetical protein
VFLRVKTGIWTISSKAGFVLRGPDAFTTLGADGKVVGGGKGSDLSVWSSFYGSFEGFFTFVGHNLRDFTAIYRGTIPGWVVALAAVGLVLIVVRNGIRRSAVLMTLLLVLVPVVMVNAGRNQSYLYPLYAMTFFAAGAAIAIPVGWLQGLAGTARNRAAVLGVGLLCGLVLVAGYGRRSVANAHASYQDPALQEQVNFSTYVLRGAANVLRQASAPTDIFMCRWGLVSYFADRPTITLPKGGWRRWSTSAGPTTPGSSWWTPTRSCPGGRSCGSC